MDEIYWLWLTFVNGIGPVTGHKLIEMYGTAKIIYENRNKLKVKDPSQRDKDAIERCSATGKLRTISLAAEAVAEKKLVVSGLVKGIDSYAHTAAIP